MARRSVTLIVLVCFIPMGCAQMTQGGSSQAALRCGAVGAAAGAAGGAAIGAAARRDVTGALIGAGIGALVGAIVGGTTCFVIAESNSRQVKDYQQTRQATDYQPARGNVVQITQYSIEPAATAPGNQIAFQATYYAMTPNPDADIAITETRILKVYDPKTAAYSELGRVANPVTMKPGTRQADGKFEVKPVVPEGKYLLIFEVSKDERRDTKELAFLVTKDQAVLGASSSRRTELAAAVEKAPAAPPLSSLGERSPAAPSISESVVAAVPKAVPNPEKIVSFQASKTGNLRAGPSTSHKIIGSIKPGERYPVLERTGGKDGAWYKIRLEDGSEGWVGQSLGKEVLE